MATIDHPSYYNKLNTECIDVVEHFDFCIGSAIKYLWRAGLKDSEADLDDYRKAVWYIQRTITRLEKERAQLADIRCEEEATSTYLHDLCVSDGEDMAKEYPYYSDMQWRSLNV